jgi:hypothetical protein
VGPLAQLVAHLHDALAPTVRGFTLPYADFLVNRPFALASASEQGSQNGCRYLLRYLLVLTAPTRLQALTAKRLFALNWGVSGREHLATPVCQADVRHLQ